MVKQIDAFQPASIAETLLRGIVIAVCAGVLLFGVFPLVIVKALPILGGR